MVSLARRIVESVAFHRSILAAILTVAAIVGLETSPAIAAEYGTLLRAVDWAILWFFAVEMLLKIIARWNRPWEFFRQPSNLFDFLVVSVCFLPLNAQFVAVLRLVRILRVLRLATALPQLQVLVGALLRSISSMGYVGVLLLIHFYIYAVFGTFLFGSHDPEHFGSLGTSMLTLFQIVTLEGWVDVMHRQMAALQGAVAPLYFITFIVLGGMIILNLFIGVIMNSMQESTAESQARRETRAGTVGLSPEDFAHLERQLAELQKQIAVMRHRITL